VFVAVAGGTAFVVLRFGRTRLRPIDRLQSLGPVVSPFVPSPALIWKELVNWVGSLVPATPKSLPLLKRRLMRAGYRNPQAVRFFYGARVCSVVMLTAIGSIVGLRTYLTTGEQETRAWTIKAGDKAPAAAGVIHTDFERGFIAAETVHFDDLVRLGSNAKAREAGKLRIEGKEYVVQDGDVIEFRFNV